MSINIIHVFLIFYLMLQINVKNQLNNKITIF